MVKRRALLLGTTGLAATGGWLLRPKAMTSGGHQGYFSALNQVLRANGEGRPTLIVDLDALDHNIRQVAANVGARDLRIVAKSIPSLPLIDYVSQKLGSRKLMAFHEPFLQAMGAPDADILFGKPMPVDAAARFYERPQSVNFDPSKQLQWLIDTPERLHQYAALATSKGRSMRVNIEIDVGLHRGGVSEPYMLEQMLRRIHDHPQLSFGGLMGYDPHVVKIPAALGGPEREFQQVQRRYQRLLAVAQGHGYGQDQRQGQRQGDKLTLNAAGSPTYQLWREVDGISNELSVGSGFVKPLDFDIPSLADHKPALYIGTPVLKTWRGNRIPGAEWVGTAQGMWDPNRARTLFVYGGYWQAQPVSPPGLSNNPLFGRSSNQEMLNGPDALDIAVDDYVFYRPTQSEFVMLQFGEILAVRQGVIQHRWQPFRWS